MMKINKLLFIIKLFQNSVRSVIISKLDHTDRIAPNKSDSVLMETY